MSKTPEITRLVPKEKKGLIVVITGNGKGKTTSALGMAVRARATI
jgi:cob(I)alamin adenosyltransferase